MAEKAAAGHSQKAIGVIYLQTLMSVHAGLSPEKLQCKLAEGTIPSSDLMFLDGDCQWE